MTHTHAASESTACIHAGRGSPHSSQISQWLQLIAPWLAISARSSYFCHCSVSFIQSTVCPRGCLRVHRRPIATHRVHIKWPLCVYYTFFWTPSSSRLHQNTDSEVLHIITSILIYVCMYDFKNQPCIYQATSQRNCGHT